MRREDLLRSYAELGVKVGLSLRPGQDVLVLGLVEHAPMVRAIASVAYEAGARYVDVQYQDQHVRRAMLQHAEDEILTWTPPWLLQRFKELEERHGAFIAITGEPEPELFADLDPKRTGKARMLALSEQHLRRVNERSISWTIVAYPNEGWASTVFGEPDVDRLWEAVAQAMRLNEPDPVEAWRDHVKRLTARAEALNERGFDAVHFSGPGTDLTIGLNALASWHAAMIETTWGQFYVPNLPTEEVFTVPDLKRVNGTVRSTRPLHLYNEGVTVRDLRMRFEDGRAVEVDASTGAEALRTQMATDEGGAMLGEVALVDCSSAVGRTGVVFSDTLFDENATCHIAVGGGLAFCVDEAKGKSSDEQRKLGINQSKIHTDFMIGGPEVDVTGIRSDGSRTPILGKDLWQLS